MKHICKSLAEIRSILPSGKSFTLVSGCFDLLHVGHLHLLEYASRLESMLVVAILSDRYIQGYKNSSRPIIPEKQRAMLVTSLRCVDVVYISDVSPNDESTLTALRPTSIVFDDSIRNSEKMKLRLSQIQKWLPCTKVHFLPRYMDESVSTTQIIDRIRGIAK
ncbi:MAG: RfaE bifunctional protein domain [Candidatus Parcubacteria bacterium]|nr:RfaE bifunctional protein domain [Candidatus Parcubacteria bacterium]